MGYEAGLPVQASPPPHPHNLKGELATIEAFFAWLMLMPAFESPAPCEKVNALELTFSSHPASTWWTEVNWEFEQ